MKVDIHYSHLNQLFFFFFSFPENTKIMHTQKELFMYNNLISFPSIFTYFTLKVPDELWLQIKEKGKGM